jgi:hypothetical protein
MSGSSLRLATFCLLLFAAALFLDTRYNQFPYFYHPDEGVKVEQVRTGDWNYHHPMLLLTVTKAAVTLTGSASTEQSVVQVGRRVSATFASLAIVALSLLAFAWRGWPAAIGTGLALLLHHQFFELSHYLKEDTALMFGVALTFLVVFLFAQRPTTLLAAALGVAVACAISGKYIGVAVLAVVIPVLWRFRAEGKARRWSAFAVALVLALLLINLPLVLHPGAFAQSFQREMQLVVHGQQGTTRRVPHTLYLNIFRDNTTPIIWVLLIVFLAKRWSERRALTLVEWLLVAFPFAFTLALSFSPKSNDRYFLPATAMFTLFAAIGALDLGQLLTRWFSIRHLWIVPCTILVLGQVVSLAPPADWRTLTPYLDAFQSDDNRDLLEFVHAHVPPTAVIVKDSRVLLPDPDNPRDASRFAPMPQKIIARRYAADLGTIDELRKKGVTHIAVSESDYGGFLLDSVHPRKGESADFTRRKAFYEELLRDGTPIFLRDRGTVLYLHPGLRLYPMPPAR